MAKLRMYYNILGTEVYYKEVASPEEAKQNIDAIADFLNFQVNIGGLPDHCSTAGLQEWDEEEEEYLDWYDEDGYDFNEHFRHKDDDWG